MHWVVAEHPRVAANKILVQYKHWRARVVEVIPCFIRGCLENESVLGYDGFIALPNSTPPPHEWDLMK
jgi:hypothetical protein